MKYLIMFLLVAYAKAEDKFGTLYQFIEGNKLLPGNNFDLKCPPDWVYNDVNNFVVESHECIKDGMLFEVISNFGSNKIDIISLVTGGECNESNLKHITKSNWVKEEGIFVTHNNKLDFQAYCDGSNLYLMRIVPKSTKKQISISDWAIKTVKSCELHDYASYYRELLKITKNIGLNKHNSTEYDRGVMLTLSNKKYVDFVLATCKK